MPQDVQAGRKENMNSYHMEDHQKNTENYFHRLNIESINMFCVRHCLVYYTVLSMEILERLQYM